MFSKEAIQGALHTERIGAKVFFFDSIDSTNECAKTLAEAGTDDGAVVVAEFQTNGRGRQGRRWTAQPGENLLFSVILRPEIARESAGFMTFFASVALARGIERLCGIRVECKWPNDLLVHGKKICGILIESAFNGDRMSYCVMGAGINVNQRSFDAEFASSATSLLNEKGAPLDRAQLLSAVLTDLEGSYEEIHASGFDALMTEWNERCSMFGRQVTVTENRNRVSGTALRLDKDGGLVVQTPSGLRTVYAGDLLLAPG